MFYECGLLGGTEMNKQKTAKFIRRCGRPWSGDARLYELFPPLTVRHSRIDSDDRHMVTLAYVIVSLSTKPFGAQSYMFASDKDGDSGSWISLPGSKDGILDHRAPLAEHGYVIVYDDEG